MSADYADYADDDLVFVFLSADYADYADDDLVFVFVPQIIF